MDYIAAMKNLILISVFLFSAASHADFYLCDRMLSEKQAPLLITGKDAKEVYRARIKRGAKEITRITDTNSESTTRVSSFTENEIDFYRVETETFKTGQIKVRYSIELARAPITNVWRLHNQIQYALSETNRFRKLKQELGFEITGKDAQEIYYMLEEYGAPEDVDNGGGNGRSFGATYFLPYDNFSATRSERSDFVANTHEEFFSIDVSSYPLEAIDYLYGVADSEGLSKTNSFYTKTMKIALPLAQRDQ